MAWELIEVAGNPTPLPHSTVDVVAAKIESKVANTVIRQLNQVCPLENLRHVKRKNLSYRSSYAFPLGLKVVRMGFPRVYKR